MFLLYFESYRPFTKQSMRLHHFFHTDEWENHHQVDQVLDEEQGEKWEVLRQSLRAVLHRLVTIVFLFNCVQEGNKWRKAAEKDACKRSLKIKKNYEQLDILQHAGPLTSTQCAVQPAFQNVQDLDGLCGVITGHPHCSGERHWSNHPKANKMMATVGELFVDGFVTATVAIFNYYDSWSYCWYRHHQWFGTEAKNSLDTLQSGISKSQYETCPHGRHQCQYGSWSTSVSIRLMFMFSNVCTVVVYKWLINVQICTNYII